MLFLLLGCDVRWHLNISLIDVYFRSDEKRFKLSNYSIIVRIIQGMFCSNIIIWKSVTVNLPDVFLSMRFRKRRTQKDDLYYCEHWFISLSIIYNNVSSGLSVRRLPSASFSHSLGIITAVGKKGYIISPWPYAFIRGRKPVLDIQKPAMLLCQRTASDLQTLCKSLILFRSFLLTSSGRMDSLFEYIHSAANL